MEDQKNISIVLGQMTCKIMHICSVALEWQKLCNLSAIVRSVVATGKVLPLFESSPRDFQLAVPIIQAAPYHTELDIQWDAQQKEIRLVKRRIQLRLSSEHKIC